MLGRAAPLTKAPLPPLLGFRANRRDNPIYIVILAPQPFYTAGDCVKGTLRVAPTSQPARISVSLRGFATIYDADAKYVQATLLHDSQDLFIPGHGGHQDGTAADGLIELPFSFTFPRNVTLPPPTDRTWFYPKDSYNHPRFQYSPGFPMPPSCALGNPMSPIIMYHIEASITSNEPGSTPIKTHQELEYQTPAPSFNPALLQPDRNFGLKLPKHYNRQKLIRTRKLFPDYGSTGKLGRFKDKLVEKELFFGLRSYSEVPYVKFNLFATPASILVIGSRVPAVITVQHLQRSESLINPPDLFVHRIKVQLQSMISTFVPKLDAQESARDSFHCQRDGIVLCDKKFDKENGEPLYDGLNLEDVVDARLVGDKMVPSFTSYGVNLEYELHIEMWGRCADRDFSDLACTQPVQVVTDWQAAGADLEPEYQEVDPMVPAFGTHTDMARHDTGTRGPAYELEPGSRYTMPPPDNEVPPPEYNP